MHSTTRRYPIIQDRGKIIPKKNKNLSFCSSNDISYIDANMTADINRPSDKVASAKLKSIYDEMRSRQLKAIEKAGTLRSDQFFVPDAKVAGEGFVPSDAISGEGDVDDRRCLAISAIVDSSVRSSWTGAFRELQRRLKEEVGQYGLIFSQDPPVVGGGQLHWTLMQLVGFPDYDVEVDQPENSVYLSSEYMDCVQDSLTVGGLDAAIHIQYVGVIVVATGLLMVGIPSLDINEARDSVRSRLADGRLPLKVRVHILCVYVIQLLLRAA